MDWPFMVVLILAALGWSAAIGYFIALKRAVALAEQMMNDLEEIMGAKQPFDRRQFKFGRRPIDALGLGKHRDPSCDQSVP